MLKWSGGVERTCSLLIVVVVAVADNRDEAEHVVVQRMPTVHANDQIAAVLQELNLYPISRSCRSRRSCEEGTGRIGTGQTGVTRRHAGGRCSDASGRRQKSVGMYRVVDTGVWSGGGVFTRVDDEIAFRVGNVVIQVLGPDDGAHASHNRAIARDESSTTSIGLVCAALAKVFRDIVPSRFLGHRMN